ncbi:MAG TPA: cupin domain-containing protein [Planctomycetes bacterium]|nr:cupin domain-containing protein [Planctomycetota bacterium]
MIIADLNAMEGRRYPAGRVTRNVVGGASPIASEHFSMGYVSLDPGGGQVPWHNHDQEEVYLLLQGEGEVCMDGERRTVRAPAAVYVPPRVFHQLTNTGAAPLLFVYCYAPAGEVAHWRQELAGTLPRAGADAPPLPEGARPQCTRTPE